MNAVVPQLPDLESVSGPERLAGRAVFLRHGLPGPWLESWKFTSLNGLAGRNWARSANDAVPEAQVASPSDAYRLVFVGGRPAPTLPQHGLPAGVRLRPLAASDLASPETPAAALAALNSAMCLDGQVIEVDDGIAVTHPVHLDFRPGSGIANGQVLLRLGPGSSLELLETHGGGDGWGNTVLRIAVGSGARLMHTRLQTEAGGAHHTALTEVGIDVAAQYRHVSVMLGGRVARHELAVRLQGRGASADLHGLALAGGRAHLDHTLHVEHAAEGCTSQQAFRNVVDGEGHAVFQGCIRVAPGAQRSDAQQICRTLLLSDGARVDTKPELEILADDVKCSHGATVGDLDAAQLFYLRARGIPAAEARRLLLAGFAEETVEAVEHPAVRAILEAAVTGWLQQEAGA